jgi:hypothetical protein
MFVYSFQVALKALFDVILAFGVAPFKPEAAVTGSPSSADVENDDVTSNTTGDSKNKSLVSRIRCLPPFSKFYKHALWIN